jgi:hypothetical protein
MEWISEENEKLFPNLTRAVYNKTSEQDSFHNCIAYATGDEGQWWEPPLQEGITEPGHYWPEGAPKDLKLSSLVKAYELHGFKTCADDAFEDGYEKVALFEEKSGDYTHAAKRLKDGTWRSKLGDSEDIMHLTCAALEGNEEKPAYGKVKIYMKRTAPNVQTTKTS